MGSAIVAGPFRRFGFAVFASTGDLSDLQSSAKRHTTIVNLGKVRSAHHQVQYLYCTCRISEISGEVEYRSCVESAIQRSEITIPEKHPREAFQISIPEKGIAIPEKKDGFVVISFAQRLQRFHVLFCFCYFLIFIC